MYVSWETGVTFYSCRLIITEYPYHLSSVVYVYLFLSVHIMAYFHH